jgi:hypothetical protein
MSKNEKGFYLFFDWIERLKELPAEDAMKIVYALGEYHKTGINPMEQFTGALKIVVALMFDQIKRGELKSEINRYNINKRWESRNTNVIPNNTTVIQSDTTYNNITNNNITNNNNKEESIVNDTKEERRKRFLPPSLDEVTKYCIERGNSVNAEQFIDFYTANGWKVGKNSMKDWKAAVRTWERNGIKNSVKNVTEAEKAETEAFIQKQYERFEAIGNGL